MTNPYPTKRFDTSFIKVEELVAALLTMPQDSWIVFESAKFRRQWEGALTVGLDDGESEAVVVKLLPMSDFRKDDTDEPFLPTEADIRAYERNADR